MEPDFDELYERDTSIVSQEFDPQDGFVGCLETYGQDRLQAEALEKERRVWSFMDNDQPAPQLVIRPGVFHGAIYYIVTTKPWTDPNQVFVDHTYGDQDG